MSVWSLQKWARRQFVVEGAMRKASLSGRQNNKCLICESRWMTVRQRANRRRGRSGAGGSGVCGRVAVGRRRVVDGCRGGRGGNCSLTECVVDGELVWWFLKRRGQTSVLCFSDGIMGCVHSDQGRCKPEPGQQTHRCGFITLASRSLSLCLVSAHGRALAPKREVTATGGESGNGVMIRHRPDDS